jgi:ABC-2 type transport system ATP-binding protein
MIHVSNLVKEYRRVEGRDGLLGSIRSLVNPQYKITTAVDSISFDIAEGELVGYIGPNGAGKSTSIKMLCGILVPTSGEVTVGGLVPHKNRMENARQIGAVFGQKTQLWWDVPVIESLNLFRDIYKVSDVNFKRNLELFNDLLDLHEFQKTPVRHLSLGQRMRADMAAALLHNPRLLLLDEPMIGVDVVVKERMRAFIHEINRNQKVTILLTTHDMVDIEKVCTRIMIIDHGHIVYDGNAESMRASYGTERTLVVEFEEIVPDFYLDNATLTNSEGTKKSFAFNRFVTSPSALITAINTRYPILDLAVEEPEIESIVRSIYRGEPATGHNRQDGILG